MRRDPQIINLYDRPLHPRRTVGRHSEASGLGTALLSCAAITLATAGFFWSYDAIAHRDGLYLPSQAHVATNEHRSPQTPETLVPDMNAPEVVRANADVPPSAFSKNIGTETERASIDTSAVTLRKNAGAAVRPKKKANVARRISSDARASYASSPATFSGSAPFGGW